MASREISSPRSKRQLLLMETRLERVRLVYDRWIRWQFSRILRSIESEFNLLDHVPDEMEAASIIAGFGSSQLSVLAHAYRGIYPSASELVAPSEGKSFRVETKGTEEYNADLERWIQLHLGKRITEIDATTLARIRLLIRTSPDVNVFRDGLKEIFSDTPQRATVIARTESTAASNVAMALTAEDYSFGRPVTKTWETRMTATVRDSHRVMQGVTIPMDEPFKVPRRDGGYDYMMFPGDYSMGASAENTVNCRCWCTYSYDD